jgi:tetratricopeptide (TPR) repeat protein
MLLAAAAAGGWVVLRRPPHTVPVPPPPAPSDYDTELGQVDRRIASLDSPATRPVGDDAMQLACSRFRRASLTREPDDFRSADAAADAVMRQGGLAEDVLLLKTRLDAWFHRMPHARTRLRTVPGLSDSLQGILLLADFNVQDGNYDSARAGYERALAIRRTWDVLARLAYLASLEGDVTGADRFYAEAEDELTAKEMRSYAWVELQRGLLELNRGRPDEAMAHYRRADQACSGYWLVREHTAEALAAQGRLDEAVALYTSVATCSGRPEVHQALGDLYSFMGQPRLAAPWHEKALAVYLASAGRGEVQYDHHLATFYADVRQDGPEAVKWAARDLELRKNYATYDALAWALYRAGRFDEAGAAMEKSLASGVQDAHVFYHAAMIYSAAGRTDEGKAWLGKAGAVNPRFMGFHVHR